MISVDGEKRKGTVITILNYAEYAEKTDNLPAHKAAHYHAHNKPSDGAASGGGAAHKGAHKPAHHEQEGNNNNIKDYRLRILTNPQTPRWKSFSQLIQMRLFTQPLDQSGDSGGRQG